MCDAIPVGWKDDLTFLTNSPADFSDPKVHVTLNKAKLRFLSLSLFLSQTHTHTHIPSIHTTNERPPGTTHKRLNFIFSPTTSSTCSRVSVCVCVVTISCVGVCVCVANV